MTDTTQVAPDQGAATPAPVTPAVEVSEDMSEREFATHLAEKWKRQREAAEAPPKAAEPPKQPIQAQEADAAPPQEDPGETTKADEPAEELPPIDPPRSWTAGEKERFASLPRETQEYIAERERDRERELRRSQNEAADKLKAIEAREREAEQARQQYESALPQLAQALRMGLSGEFADIKTQEDVTKLATEDWPRFARYQAKMMEIGNVEQELAKSQERQKEAFQKQWSDFASKEDRAFTEAHPEYSDKDKSAKMADAVIKTWETAGGNRDDLMKSYHGEVALSARSAAFQSILVKAALYDQAKATAAKPAPKPVPPVQKPGTAKAPVDAADAEIQTLQRRFSQTGTLKDATALRLAKMKRAANQ